MLKKVIFTRFRLKEDPVTTKSLKKKGVNKGGFCTNIVSNDKTLIAFQTYLFYQFNVKKKPNKDYILNKCVQIIVIFFTQS